MSNPSTYVKSLIAAVANGVCLSQTPLAGGALTLNGSLVAAGVAIFDTPRRVLVASSGADGGRTFTIVGTKSPSANLAQGTGPVISEIVTGVTSVASQFTKQDFSSVTSVTVDAATAGAITVGTNGVGSSEWCVDDFLKTNWNLTVAVSINSGAATYTVEWTLDDPNATGSILAPAPQQASLAPRSYVPPLAWPDAVLQNQTGNGVTTFAGQPVFAHRLTINAGTGQVVMQSLQGGNASY